MSSSNTYTSQEYVASYTLLTQHSIDDPSYYPGNPNKFMDFLKDSLDVGDKGLDYLNDKIIEEEVEELKSIENEATEEEKVDWQERMADLDETIERTGSELKAARDEMKALALDFGMDVANVLGAFATGGLSTVPAIIKTVGKKVGGGLLRRLLNKFKTKSQKKVDRKDFAQRMRDEMSGKTTKKSKQFNPDVLGTNYGDKTDTGGISGYRGSRNLRNSYKPQGKLIAEGLVDEEDRKMSLMVAQAQANNKELQEQMDEITKKCHKEHGKDLVPANYPEPYYSEWKTLQSQHDWDGDYPFNAEYVEDFARFCESSGGFDIC